MHSKDARTAEKALPICQVTAEQMGYEVVDITFTKEPAGWYLRIFLDAKNGITIDDCEKYHRALQPQLDEIDYDFLEVSSPGADRPIKNERDAEKNIGALVEIKLFKPVEGKKTFRGIFKGLMQDGYKVEVEQQLYIFPKKGVAVARRVIDLDHIEQC